MNKKNKGLPELLAPAGSFEHLKAAILAGADAVYLGGSKFGARAYANNFSEEELIEAIYYAHLYDRRIYMTVNTLMTDEELEGQFYEFMKPYYEAGLDGVIVQDMGTVAFIRKHFPKMEIHGSTQMTITTVKGADAAKRMGMNRVVPAREMSMEELCAIKEQTGLEIEVFVHGALCYCYSGQCLLSAVYGGRSGNRGRCAQPCRLPYQVVEKDGTVRKADNYLLSPKDLCTLVHLPEVIENGLDSLKIEGRMKNTEFVAGVVAIYRKYLDYYAGLLDKSTYQVDPKDMATLEELFSRSGFTEGYFHKHNGREMMSMKLPNHQGRRVGTIQSVKKNQITVSLTEKLHAKDILVIPVGNAKEREEIILTVPASLDGMAAGKKVTLNVPNPKSIRAGVGIFRRKNMGISEWVEQDIYAKDLSRPVDVSVLVKDGQPVEVIAKSGSGKVCVVGEIPEKAKGKPVTENDIKKQMNKTGNVPFFIQNITIDLDEGLFLPLSIVKGLRQEVYQLLEDALKKSNSRIAPKRDDGLVECKQKSLVKENAEAKWIVTVYDEEVLQEALVQKKVDGIVIPMDFWEKEKSSLAKEKIQKAGKKAYLSLPRIIREKDFWKMGYHRKDEICISWDGYYAHHINEAQLLYEYKEAGFILDSAEVIMAASLYQWNKESHEEMKRLFTANGVSFISEVPLEFDEKKAEGYLDAMRDDATEILLYGHYPVMVSTQCLNKNSGRCTKVPEQFFLKDAKGRKLPISTHCQECFNMIWTDVPRDWLSELSDFKYRANRIRLDLFGCGAKDLNVLLRVL